MSKPVESLSELIKEVSAIKVDKDNFLVFRGESKDYGDSALTPNIYRDGYIENEDKIYREMQRFNDQEFLSDKTAFDKLSRMQHHGGKTRLLDVSEDLMSAVYMALDNDLVKEENALVYIFEIKEKNIKYYDSDAVSVISNLAKIPLQNKDNHKSKQNIIFDIKGNGVKKFNKKKSAKFLRHEIREEKPQFEPIIDPKHLTSVFYVQPKLTSNRIKAQKGSFLLFGLNPNNPEKPIRLIEKNSNECKLLKNTPNITHPIEKCYIFELKYEKIKKIKEDLEKIGITTPFIYPELDKVANYLSKLSKNLKQ